MLFFFFLIVFENIFCWELRWDEYIRILQVNVSSGNGLVLSGTKPLPETVLTKIVATL